MKEEQGVPCYKIVRKLSNGKRVSSFIDHPKGRSKYGRLGYKKGEITETPYGSKGIFCHRTIDGALSFPDVWPGNGPVVAEVHEALGYGPEIRFWSTIGLDGILVNYGSIRLGKCVAKKMMR